MKDIGVGGGGLMPFYGNFDGNFSRDMFQVSETIDFATKFDVNCVRNQF